MKTEKTIDGKVLGFSAVAALLGMGFAAAMSASADTGVGYGYGAQNGMCDPEQHEAIEEAIESGDYDAWVELMDGRGRITTVVTEDNFETFAAMHEAMEDGDIEEAQALREELGLGVRPQDGSGFRGGMGRGMMHRSLGDDSPFGGYRWDR